MTAVVGPVGGETSLSKLLSTLTTTLHPSTYVFVTLPRSAKMPCLSEVQMIFQEVEGTTIITTLQYAKQLELSYSFPSRMITLDAHSSLDAVGFMAVIATRLASKGMGVNPVSGFYHDHLFVPEGREQEAIVALKELAEEHRHTELVNPSGGI